MALCLVSKEYEVVLEGRTLSNMSYELFWGVHEGESNATLNPLPYSSSGAPRSWGQIEGWQSPIPNMLRFEVDLISTTRAYKRARTL